MKIKFALIWILFLCFNVPFFGQGSESFANCNATGFYTDGSYVGDDGITWSYIKSRNEGLYAISGKGILLRNLSAESKITSSSIPNGIGHFTCKLKKGFTNTGNRQVELFVNGISQGTSIAWDNDDVQTFSINTLNITGDVIIEIRNITAHQVVIDDISWTAASTEIVDYCNLQFPADGNLSVGTIFNVFAQVYKAGVTEVAGPSSDIVSWIGYSTTNNHPSSADWSWVPATYNAQIGNNDEYMANIGSSLSSHTYYYASRFQIEGGPYRYGGYNASGGGFWDGTYNVSGKLSVDTVDFCNLQFPGVGTITVGDPYVVYGQVMEQGITPGTGQGPGIEAEIGYSTTDSNPNTWTNWVSAAYNPTCADCNFTQNDEYFADIGPILTDPGTFYYATRFRLNDGVWHYGGILADGSAGGFWDGSTYISGVLNVTGPRIRVEGNLGTFPLIANGDTTPQGTDNTLFKGQLIGATQAKTYRIRNLGNTNLMVSSITITGLNPGDFTIKLLPETSILPGAYSIFEIEFSPLVAGERNATVSIVNNDPYNNPYTFAIRGTGKCIASAYTIFPATGPAGTIVTITGTNFDTSSKADINGIVMTPNIINATTMEVTIPINSHTGNITVVNGLDCTSTIPFTIIDHKIGGCEGDNYVSDLFISEVTDATVGGLSYIEIYNGTGNTINLSNYSIEMYYNGNTVSGNTVALDGVTLPHNATHTLAIGVVNSPSSSNSCLKLGGNGQLADQMNIAQGINKKDNEHDMIRLVKSNGTIVVDQFGVYNDRTWMDSTIITGDRGFNFKRRNLPSPIPNPYFDLNDWQIIDWVGSGSASCPTNDYSGIGQYDFSGGKPPLVEVQPFDNSSTCRLSTTLNVSGAESFPGSLPLAYQWFYNATGAADWIEILPNDPNYSGQQSPTLVIENTLPLDGYQYYVQIRENSATCYMASTAVRLTLSQTSWNGVSWHPTIPDSNIIAILNSNYTTNPASGSFTACSLVVNSGHTLNVTDHFFVEAINDVIVYGNSTADLGSIIVDSKGSFVQRGDDTFAGIFKLNNTAKAQVIKNTDTKYNWYDYTYWGSPVTNETVEAVLSMASPSRRFMFKAENYEDSNGDDIDDNNDAWQQASGTMIPGIGYAATSNKSGAFPRIDTTEFNGPFNNGNIPVTIHTNTITTDKDWNLIANPYASAIDFHALYDENSHVIEGSAYLWSQASPPEASNPGPDKLNFNGNDYVIITVGSGNIAVRNTDIPSDYIPSGQGFFVIGINSGGTLTFKNSMRMADGTSNDQFFRPSNSNEANKLWLNLTSDNGIFNQVLVAYVEGATDGFDGFAFDAERNLSSGLNAIIYTKIPNNDKKYAIQGKDVKSISVDEQIALGFKTSITQPTLYKLAIAQTQGLFFDTNPIFLRDNDLNVYHDLTVGPYHFTSVPGEFNTRFSLLFKNDTLATEELAFNENHLSIVELNNGHIEFTVPPHVQMISVEIIDLLGRRLYYLQSTGTTEVYNLSNLKPSAYIAKVALSNGQILTKRAIKRR